MHWTTRPFIELHETIQQLGRGLGEEALAAGLVSMQTVFDEVFEDILNPLHTKPKSDQSRSELKKGILTIDDTKYQLNEDYISTACLVADELNLDEMIAAEILHQVYNETAQLNMSPVEGCVAFFHVRRKYILDLLAFVFDRASDDHQVSNPGDQDVVAWQCKKLVSQLADKAVFGQLLGSFQTVESLFGDMDERDKRAALTGQGPESEFVRIVRLRRDFLHMEHDSLGQILYGAVGCGLASATDIGRVLDRVKVQAEYDTNLLHYLPALFLHASRLDPAVLPEPNAKAVSAGRQVVARLRTEKFGESWKLPYVGRAVQFIYLSSLSGLARLDPSQEIDYESEIISPCQQAIDEGALELLMAVAADTSKIKTRLVRYYDMNNYLQLRVPEFKSLSRLTAEFTQCLVVSLEDFVESVITNLADILKQMHIGEEDSYLAMASADRFDDRDDGCGVDLERFFELISYLYYDRPDSADKFWADPEGNLHGFLVWASEFQFHFMAAAYADMLASLCCGPSCASAAYRFLQTENPQSDASERTATTMTNSSLVLSSAPKFKKTRRISLDNILHLITDTGSFLLPKPTPPGGNSHFAEDKELGRDSMLLMFAYLRIIGEIARYDPSARSAMLEERFSPVTAITSLLAVKTQLHGPAFEALAGFAQTTSLDHRRELWRILDHWAFKSVVYDYEAGGAMSPSVPVNERLENLFRSFSDTVGFVQLMAALMRPVDGAPFQLPLSETLGSQYRQPGAWPYIDFIVTDVFYSSASPEFTQDEQLALQLPCMGFILHCLELFDPSALKWSSVLNVDLNTAAATSSYADYIRVHPCTPTMSALFHDKIYNLLIGIVQSRVKEELQPDLDQPTVQRLLHGLRIINLVLDLEDVFIDVLSKDSIGSNSASTSLVPASARTSPTRYGTSGLRSFEEALLFNLPVVADLALYASSANLDIARLSVELLDRLSKSPQFYVESSDLSSGPRVRKSRLLTTVETVDESIRIREGFIEQLERDYALYTSSSGAEDDDAAVSLKLQVLKFLSSSLAEPGLCLFLLGFKINSDGTLDADDERGGIASETCLLHSVVTLQQQSVSECGSGGEFLYESCALADACSDILVRLLENEQAHGTTLDYLRERNFLSEMLALEPVFDSNAALWDGQRASGSTSFYESRSADALNLFVSHRTKMLNYISTEIHSSAVTGSRSLVARYLAPLASFRDPNSGRAESAKILELFDVLELQLDRYNTADYGALALFGPELVAYFSRDNYDFANDRAALNDLKQLMDVKSRDLVRQGVFASLEDEALKNARAQLASLFACDQAFYRIHDTRLLYLESWSKLVLVVLHDGHMAIDDRNTLVLETIQTIVPKIVDYSASEVSLASVLASLAVSLFKEHQQGILDVTSAGHDRTHSLFLAALSAMQAPSTTEELRANCYILCYEYLKLCLASSDSTAECLQAAEKFRLAGDRLVETLCQDALSSEGLTRIVALVLLEVLALLATRTGVQFVLESMGRYNLLVMLVRSISRIDQAVAEGRDSNDQDKLFYQIKVFKATMSFLLQIAQTRTGALQTLQSGFFAVLQNCQFLTVDLDVVLSVPGPRAQFHYDMLVPTFRIIAAILLSMGPENEPVITATREFLRNHRQLLTGLLKRDAISLSGQSHDVDALDELSVLLVTLISLTKFD